MPYHVTFIPKGWPKDDSVPVLDYYVKNEPYDVDNDFTSSSTTLLRDAWKDVIYESDAYGPTRVQRHQYGNVIIKNEFYREVRVKYVSTTPLDDMQSNAMRDIVNNMQDKKS